MRVCVIGTGLLARTITKCLSDWHELSDDIRYGLFDVVWIAHDTPIRDHVAQPDEVLAACDETLMHCPGGQIVIVSSQLPCGSIAKLDRKYPHLNFVCIPENLQTGRAEEGFRKPGPVIVGTADRTGIRTTIEQLYKPFTSHFLWMSVESAEFVKHARNAYLAAMISFANELGAIAIKHGANPGAIEMGLKADSRVSSTAPLRYGLGGIGDHLRRDVAYLLAMEPNAAMMHGVKRSADEWEAQHG